MVEHPQVGVVHGAGPGGQGGQVRRLALGKLTLDEVVSQLVPTHPFAVAVGEVKLQLCILRELLKSSG